MIIQYPHTITFTKVSGRAMDASGNWTGGSTTIVNKSCRYEPNGSDNMIAGPDGTEINYGGIAYLPLPVDTMAPGTTVEVKDGAIVLCKETVKRFSAGQLNVRVWL